MRWRKETIEMDIQEYGYSLDGNRFYGRYRTRALAEAEARELDHEPTHTAERRVDGNSPQEIIPRPGTIQEILDTTNDDANVHFRAYRVAVREARVALREAKKELRKERRRVERLNNQELADERELADMAHAEEADEREALREVAREAKREAKRLEKLAEDEAAALAEEEEEVVVEEEVEETPIVP